MRAREAQKVNLAQTVTWTLDPQIKSMMIYWLSSAGLPACGKSLSRVWFFMTPWTVACQAPLSMGFSRQEYWSGVPVPSPVWMWELDYKENWALKNWCFWPVLLEKTLESPLDSKEIQPVHPKGNQSWIFFGRTNAEAPILWPPDVKDSLIGKDPDARKDWRWEEKGTTEDEMIGWYHWLDGHEFEQASGVGDGQEAWSVAVHGVTKSRTLRSNWTENWEKLELKTLEKLKRIHSHTSIHDYWKNNSFD